MMNVERSITTGSNGSMSYMTNWTDLNPSRAGLAAALRRAFALPADENARKFEELLARIR